mgnify:FL=1|tara:strand:- start:961 stop:1167 length:207 start_codon:yes stop_codon:yes gene_type:complete
MNLYETDNKTRHFSGEVSTEGQVLVAFDKFHDLDPVPYSEVSRDLNAEHSMKFIGHKGLNDFVNQLAD